MVLQAMIIAACPEFRHFFDLPLIIDFGNRSLQFEGHQSSICTASIIFEMRMSDLTITPASSRSISDPSVHRANEETSSSFVKAIPGGGAENIFPHEIISSIHAMNRTQRPGQLIRRDGTGK
jgi:hypothetical protein